MQKLLFLAVLLLIPWPSQAQNNSPSVPDLNGWKFTVRPLEVKIYGQVTAYFGLMFFVRTRRTPMNLREF